MTLRNYEIFVTVETKITVKIFSLKLVDRVMTKLVNLTSALTAIPENTVWKIVNNNTVER